MTQTHAQSLADGECEFFPADTRLQARALRAGSPADIAQLLNDAEAALSALRGEFDRWLENEVERLGAMAAEYEAAPTQANLDLLYRALHDVRGNAATFGNPLAARIADAACKLVEAAGMVPAAIMGAHVQAVQAVVREKAAEATHPVASLILAELSALGRKILPADTAG